MSDYLPDFDFDALMAPKQQSFDCDFLDYPAPIGQNEVVAGDDNATYGFDPTMDVDAVPDLDFGFLDHPAPLGKMEPRTTISMLAPGLEPRHPCPTRFVALLPNGVMPLHNGAEPSLPTNSGLSSIAPVPPKNEIDKFVCEICHKSFETKSPLDQKWGHDNAIRICGLLGCDSRFDSCHQLRAHRRRPHLPSHHPVWDDLAITCAECNEAFGDEKKLRKHAKNQKHSPYACGSGAKFARNDVLNRHIKSFTTESAQYPYSFCKRHRGKQASCRRDHLVQHLQGYHKMEPEEVNNVSPPLSRLQSRQTLVCPHADCDKYRDDTFKSLPWQEQFERRPFQKQSDYNKHMRGIHKESAFSCRVGGCDRVGAKGYMREKDLIKHIADKHPEAPSYSYVPPKPTKFRCAACGNELSTLNTLQDHGRWCCGNIQAKRFWKLAATTAE